MSSGKKLRLNLSLFALTIVLLAALSACGGSTTPAANTPGAPSNTVAAPGNTPAAAATSAQVQGGTLRIGLDVDPDSADFRLSTNTSAVRMRELVYDGLVYIKADYAPTALLAESWDNPDDKTWVFHLRKGVKFHNGTELKAADVKFTFDSILDPKTNAPGRANLSVIQKIEAVDDYTVRFTLASAFAPFLSYMNTGILSKAYADSGADLATKPMGTGPFKFVSWTKGSSISFEAFPDYWGGRPKLDKIDFKIVPDNSARVVAVESGDLDMVISPLSPQDVQRMAGKQGFVVERVPAAGYTYINLNCSDPVLSDVKVRQAISYLVNREQITATVYKGIGQVAKGPIPPGMWAYTADLPSYDYNATKAGQLLDEAGWKAGSDGKRVKNGTPLTINLLTHTEDPDRRTLIEALQAELTKAGITSATSVKDFNSLLPDLTAQKYQTVVIGWLGLSNPDAAMFRQFTDGGSANYGKCVDPQVDSLIKQARTTLDQAKAKDMYAQAQKLVVQDAFYIFVQYQEVISIHKANLQGFQMNPITYFHSLRTTSLGK